MSSQIKHTHSHQDTPLSPYTIWAILWAIWKKIYYPLLLDTLENLADQII